MNPIRPVAIRLGAQPWLPKFAKLIVGLDTWIQRLSRGRLTLLVLVGLPELTLFVPGRKSGIPRTTPLLCVPHQGGWLVVGSNWGQPKAPAWVTNLMAVDTARINYRGQSHVVVPRPVTGEERASVWPVMVATWPNYDRYAERTDREIPVIRLVPVEPAGG